MISPGIMIIMNLRQDIGRDLRHDRRQAAAMIDFEPEQLPQRGRIDAYLAGAGEGPVLRPLVRPAGRHDYTAWQLHLAQGHAGDRAGGLRQLLGAEHFDPPPKPKAGQAKLYSVGQVAAKVGRTPCTIRRWEQDGRIPRAGRTNARTDAAQAKRRWTEDQLAEIMRLAQTSYRPGKTVSKTPRRGAA